MSLDAMKLAQEPMFDCPRCGHCCSRRQWQGLTDMEKHLFVEWAHPDIIEAIELKLKEKNDV